MLNTAVLPAETVWFDGPVALTGTVRLVTAWGILPEKLKLAGKLVPAPTKLMVIWCVLPSALVPPLTKLLRSKVASLGIGLVEDPKLMYTPYMFELAFISIR